MTDNNKDKLKKCQIELNSIKKWIYKNPLDTNVRYLVSYSVIRASGTIEVVFKSILYEHLSISAIDDTKKYLERNIVISSSNPNTGNIEAYLSKFNGSKSSNFQSKIKGSNEKGGLNSLVTLRNDIAHGKSCNASIDDVINYYKCGIKIIKILESVL